MNEGIIQTIFKWNREYRVSSHFGLIMDMLNGIMRGKNTIYGHIFYPSELCSIWLVCYEGGLPYLSTMGAGELVFPLSCIIKSFPRTLPIMSYGLKHVYAPAEPMARNDHHYQEAYVKIPLLNDNLCY